MVVAPPSDTESDTSMTSSAAACLDVILDAPTSGAVDDVATEPTVRFTHDELNVEFTGVRHRVSCPEAEVHQFRGIKYATIPMRFRRSVLFDAYSLSVDATKFGPICPQIRNRWLESRLYGLPREVIPSYKSLHEPPQNEFDCLNLTITTPGARTGVLEPLPVMVWIHGGGNVTGAGTDWIWDAGALVRKSVEIGKPVIIVAINYRLGLFGFGASELLREDNAAAGEEGVGNYGLTDQRTALYWIREHIAGFGGDPYDVTMFGSSWGAADIHAHLLSAQNERDVFADPSEGQGPLFRRAILQSGALVPSSSVVQDMHLASHFLGRIMGHLHCATIDQLREIPAAKLVSAQGERVRPVDDGVFLRHDWRTLALPYATRPDVPTHWRQDVTIGDVACESVLWAAPAKMWAADAVSRRARAIVQSVRRADALMRAYEIVDGNAGPGSPTRELHQPIQIGSAIESDAEESDDASVSDADSAEFELAERVMELMNDVAFAWPVDVAARCAADSAFLFEHQAPQNSAALLAPPPVRKGGDGSGYLSSVSESEASDSAMDLSGSDTADVSKSANGSVGAVTPPRYKNAPFVYRYVFDQASPYTGSPHHGVDLLYLFGNIPFPSDPELTPEENDEVNWDRMKVRDEVQRKWLQFAAGEAPWDAPLTPQPPPGIASMSDRGMFATPMLSPVSSFGMGGLAPTPGSGSPVSSRASSFSSAFGTANPFALVHSHHAHAQHNGAAVANNNCGNLNGQHHGHHTHVHGAHPHQHPHLHSHHHHGHHGGVPPLVGGPAHPPPISISAADRVFVFGPEGETGERSATIFAGRRRVHAWREALAPLGLATAQKVGLELGNGPPPHMC